MAENTEAQIQITTVEASYVGMTRTEKVNVNTRVDSNCTAISFINTGDVDAEVLGIPLNVNDGMLSFGGEPQVKDVTQYDIRFTPGSAGVAPMVIVIRKSINRVVN